MKTSQVDSSIKDRWGLNITDHRSPHSSRSSSGYPPRALRSIWWCLTCSGDTDSVSTSISLTKHTNVPSSVPFVKETGNVVPFSRLHVLFARKFCHEDATANYGQKKRYLFLKCRYLLRTSPSLRACAIFFSPQGSGSQRMFATANRAFAKGDRFSKLRILTTSGTRLPVILGRSQKFGAREPPVSPFLPLESIVVTLKIRRSEKKRSGEKRERKRAHFPPPLLFCSFLEPFVLTNLFCVLFSGFVCVHDTGNVASFLDWQKRELGHSNPMWRDNGDLRTKSKSSLAIKTKLVFTMNWQIDIILRSLWKLILFKYRRNTHAYGEENSERELKSNKYNIQLFIYKHFTF